MGRHRTSLIALGVVLAVLSVLLFLRDTEPLPSLTTPPPPPPREVEPPRPVELAPPVLVEVPFDAGPTPQVDPWAELPLDPEGRSLGGGGQGAFRQALVREIRPALRRCMELVPLQKAVAEFTIELFVEATVDGFAIVRARVPSEAGLDVYERRCFETAFEVRLVQEHPGVEPGARFHLGFPLQIFPREQAE